MINDKWIQAWAIQKLQTSASSVTIHDNDNAFVLAFEDIGVHVATLSAYGNTEILLQYIELKQSMLPKSVAKKTSH